MPREKNDVSRLCIIALTPLSRDGDVSSAPVYSKTHTLAVYNPQRLELRYDR